MKLIKTTLLAAALGFNAIHLLAQDPPAPGDQPAPPSAPVNAPGAGSPRTRHLMALLQALDANHDGTIDSNEMAKAPEVIRQLERNRPADGAPEGLGPRPRHGNGPRPFADNGGPVGPGPRGFGGPGAGPGAAGGPGFGPGPGPEAGAPMDAPEPPQAQAGPNGPRPPRFAGRGPQGGFGEMPPGAPGMMNIAARRHAPRSPLMEALDTNHDGVLDADEIANASANLKKLDKNNDGKLTEDELHPVRAPRGARLNHPPVDGPRPAPGPGAAPLGSDRGPGADEDEAPLPPPPGE